MTRNDWYPVNVFGKRLLHTVASLHQEEDVVQKDTTDSLAF